MIPPRLFRDSIVGPSLMICNIWSTARERLVMATGLAESNLAAVRQKGGGPALGYFQMEPATHDDIWNSFLGGTRRAPLLEGLRELSSRPGAAAELETNPFYAAAMCGIFYLRIKESLPPDNDLDAIARYWKKYYNTPLGKGTVEAFIRKAAAAMAI